VYYSHDLDYDDEGPQVIAVTDSLVKAQQVAVAQEPGALVIWETMFGNQVANGNLGRRYWHMSIKEMTVQ
jgi:hypothetical protein